MNEKIKDFICCLDYDSLLIIKQAYEEFKDEIELIEKMNKVCSHYLKKYNIEGSVLLSENNDDKVEKFILQTKNASIDELKIIYSFFAQVYDITNNQNSFKIKHYINLIIYIKEHLELIKNNRIDEMDLDLFEFYIKRMYKGMLIDMNNYFDEDLVKLTDNVIKKYELRRKLNG